MKEHFKKTYSNQKQQLNKTLRYPTFLLLTTYSNQKQQLNKTGTGRH